MKHIELFLQYCYTMWIMDDVSAIFDLFLTEHAEITNLFLTNFLPNQRSSPIPFSKLVKMIIKSEN